MKKSASDCGGKSWNKRGESMVVAVILMFLFLMIGISVITAASMSSATTNERVAQQKAYYLARSTLDTLDESIQRGDLGKHIRADAYKKLPDPGETTESIQIDGALSPVLTLPASLPADGYEILDCTITYTGAARRVVDRDLEDTIREQRAVLALEDVTCAFTAKFKENEYRLSVSYSLESEGNWISGDEWGWSDRWTVKTIS